MFCSSFFVMRCTMFFFRCDGFAGRVCLSCSLGFVQRGKFALKTVLCSQGNWSTWNWCMQGTPPFLTPFSMSVHPLYHFCTPKRQNQADFLKNWWNCGSSKQNVVSSRDVQAQYPPHHSQLHRFRWILKPYDAFCNEELLVPGLSSLLDQPENVVWEPSFRLCSGWWMVELNQRQIYICSSKFKACSHAFCSYQEEFWVLLINDMHHL